ncbi:hypothetical protein ABWL39_09035 [Chitinivorax sp. PXF-14]|uniref:hypothetical protein n=1 Tax=Chitinivorax sp. PXF-14 TaxID=3230488 RepID=UPI003465B142
MAAAPPSKVFKKDFIAPDQPKPAPMPVASAAPAVAATPILSISPIMVGLCLLALIGIRIAYGGTGSGLINLALAADALLYLVSALFAFISTRRAATGARWEILANLIFLLGLLTMVATTVAFAFGTM